MLSFGSKRSSPEPFEAPARSQSGAHAPSWRIETSDQPPSVVATFDGWLSASEGVTSADAFRGTISLTRRRVVWDVRKMTGHDTGARLAWQEALWPVRKNISGLRVVGAKGLVRVGAISLAIVLGVPWELS